ncbi:MAG: type IV pilus modification PilV family protein [Actinomycetota bacterium]
MTKVLRRWQRGERGFTLLEVVMALSVFTIVLLSVIPLMWSSVKGATLSRSQTRAKNIAVQAMERVRGLPFYVSYSAQPRQVDVLDLYFPRATGPGYDAGNGSFTTTCPSGSPVTPECPFTLPAGHSLTYVTEFIKPGPVSPSGRETYVSVAPATGYAFDSATDLPTTQLLRMAVTVNWSSSGQARDFTLTSLVGERKYEDKLRGAGKIDYAVQVLTSYLSPTGGPSELDAYAGAAESIVSQRLFGESDQIVRAGEATLVRPGDPATILSTLGGVSAVLQAPPDADPTTVPSVGTVQMDHPDADTGVGGIVYIDDSNAENLGVKVASELPVAHGGFRLNNGGSSQFDFWVNNQADNNTPLLLDVGEDRPVFSIRPQGSSVLNGSTSATTTPLTGTRQVATTAAVGFANARLFPVSFIPTNQEKRSVVVFSDFSASVSCTSTAATTALAEASYTVKLDYWAELDTDDDKPEGAYQTIGPWTITASNGSPATASDPLAALKADNPMVYEDPTDNSLDGSPNDVYLFPETHDHDGVVHTHPGYLEDWSALTSLPTSVTNAGRETSAAIEGAIRVDTAKTNPVVDGSELNIALGKISCEAVDHR